MKFLSSFNYKPTEMKFLVVFFVIISLSTATFGIEHQKYVYTENEVDNMSTSNFCKEDESDKDVSYTKNLYHTRKEDNGMEISKEEKLRINLKSKTVISKSLIYSTVKLLSSKIMIIIIYLVSLILISLMKNSQSKLNCNRKCILWLYYITLNSVGDMLNNLFIKCM